MSIRLACYANCDDVFMVWFNEAGATAPIKDCLGFCIEARDDVSRPNELRTPLRQVIQVTGASAYTDDHMFCPGRR